MRKISVMTRWLLVAFFLGLTTLIAIRDLGGQEHWNMIWYCSLAPLLFAIGFAVNNVQFVKGVISVGIIGQAVATVSIILAVFFNVPIAPFAGISSYGWYYVTLAFVAHLFSANVAFGATYKEKTTRASLYYALGVLALIFTLTIVFTPAAQNVNYLFQLYTVPHAAPYTTIYTTSWIALVFALLVLPGYYLQRAVYKYARTQRQRSSMRYHTPQPQKGMSGTLLVRVKERTK